MTPTKHRAETITFTNGKNNLDPQRTHKRLVNLLNQFYGVERFKVVPNLLGVGDYDKIDTQQLSSGVGLLVNSNNLAGGDVGNVDLYKLVEVYLMDDKKRYLINELL